MEMRTSSHEKAQLFGHVWCWLKALPEKLKAKMVDIARNTQNLGKDDPRRLIHSVKVGFSLTLVSIFYYYQPLYKKFGVSAMWAVMTVVVVFEFYVGMHLFISFNFMLFIDKVHFHGTSIFNM